MTKKLHRSKKDKIFGGVAGGLGEYFDIDPTIIRLIFVLFFAFGGSGFLIYIILWLILPGSNLEPAILNEEKVKDMADEIKERAQDFGKEMKKNHEVKELQKRRGHLFGWILVFLGVIALANKFMPHWFGQQALRYWPLFLILLGFYLIVRSDKNK